MNRLQPNRRQHQYLSMYEDGEGGGGTVHQTPATVLVV